LGVILAEGEKLGEAIDAFTKVVALAPTWIDAHYNLALTHQRSGLEICWKAFLIGGRVTFLFDNS
jgi:hypothetical protein